MFRRRSLVLFVGLLAAATLIPAACTNAPAAMRPTPIVTVISATAVPSPVAPTAESEAVVPTDGPPTPASPDELPDAQPEMPNPPLGIDLELVPGVFAYNLGEAAVVQDRFPEDSRFRQMPVRLEGVMALPAASDRPAPLVMILHGNHRGCPTDPDRHGVDPWPCSVEEEQANYKGFDYLVQALADAGYVAVSINVNGEYTLGFGEGDLGERMSQIIQLHLEAMEEATGGGQNDFGVDLTGRIDMSRLALMGHSQGGELASRLTYQEGWDDPYSLVDNGFGPVDGLILIAASNNAQIAGNPSVPMATLLSACDGDVRQLNGQAFYESLRLDPSEGSVGHQRAHRTGQPQRLQPDSERRQQRGARLRHTPTRSRSASVPRGLYTRFPGHDLGHAAG